MSKDRRLGRGLAALLGGGGPEESGSAPGGVGLAEPPSMSESGHGDGSGHSAGAVSGRGESGKVRPSGAAKGSHDATAESSGDGTLRELPVERIDANPFQPRQQFDERELAELAASLDRHQMLQPVLVREFEGRYQLISGERRLRAAVLAGWTTIPARVRQVSDEELAELALVENLQRRDLSPMEKARSFRQYLDMHHATQEELAGRLKIDRSTVANLVRLLELPESIQRLVDDGKLGAGHARALLALGDTNEQTALGRQIVTEGWSVRETERQVRTRLKGSGSSRLGALEKSVDQVTRKGRKDRQIATLEGDLRRALGTKVEIQSSGKHKGKVVIHFGNQGEFERLYAALTEGRVQPEAA